MLFITGWVVFALLGGTECAQAYDIPAGVDISQIDPSIIASLTGSTSAVPKFNQSGEELLNKVVPANVFQPMIKIIGLTMDHRSFQPATLLDKKEINLGIGIAMTKVPSSDIGELLSLAGKGGSSSTQNTAIAVPIPRLVAHYGFGFMDVGLSWIQYKKLFRLLGFELKIPLYRPEEGLHWAFRISYTLVRLSVSKEQTFYIDNPIIPSKPYAVPILASLQTDIGSITSQIIASKKLSFADPYVGVGVQRISGKTTIKATPNSDLAKLIAKASNLELPSVTYTGGGWNYYAFLGVQFKTPLGFMLTIDGSYSVIGANSIGLLIGWAF